jgi:hypothetical protein
VVAFHRQNQVRQLEDTWPIDGLCIYKFQLSIQVDRRQVHSSHLGSNRRSELRLAKHQKSLTSLSPLQVWVWRARPMKPPVMPEVTHNIL